MALAVVLATFLLMFLAFGSLVLPVQAIVMNILSLGAMFGVVTWIFQDGHLSGLLGFTPNGTISPTIPILMFAIMFGLSMDYQVFLLSRIRESYDITGDNTSAIAAGLQRTGGVITSAALLLVIVIGLFSLSSITFIKMLGVGMIVALILDATLVRMLLVPAVMRLAGDANWWAPAPLRRFYARHGIHEDDGPAPGALEDPTRTRAGRYLVTRGQSQGPARSRPARRADRMMTGFRPFFNPATGEWIEFTAVAEDSHGQLVRFSWRSVPGGVITEHVHPRQEERFTILRRGPLHPQRRGTRGQGGRDGRCARGRPPLRGKPRTGRDRGRRGTPPGTAD